MKKYVLFLVVLPGFFLAAFVRAAERPEPNAAQMKRIREGVEIYGIVHWGLNTFTDREWGFGDENPADLNPAKFDAEQIVGACKAGGLQGLIVVAKHHDGFCLWPTKTTGHNISKSPFRRGKGDYVKEMEQACRKFGLKFGVYVSPWDRNNALYGTEKYVTDVFQAQIRELLSGDYGEIFEKWFDGANGGDGYYGGAREKRKIPSGYYRYETETFAMVRRLQPNVCIFNESDQADFRFGGNEQGIVDPDSRSTGGHYDGIWNNYRKWANTGLVNGTTFHPVEADFPLRPGWFYHAKERGKTKNAAYLMQRYLSAVGNAATLNLGIAPNMDGLLDEDDVKALKGFGDLQKLFFAHPAKNGEPFNVIVMTEDVSAGERVDAWTLMADGKKLLSGRSIGIKRIRVLDDPVAADAVSVKTTSAVGQPGRVSLTRYIVNPEIVKAVLAATTESGETDTAKWMTAEAVGGMGEAAVVPYKNPNLPVDKRVDDLVSRMTVQEKCAQLGMLRGRFACSREPGSDRVVLATNMVERMRANPFGKITQMLRSDFFTRRNWDNGLLPHQQAATVNAIQRIAVEETRLGIPIWFEDEAPHGIMALGEPVYPTGLGLGSTYDKDLMRRIGEAMGRSARAKGLICVLAPILDIARDPRWSRVEECFGEDPTLVTLLGEAETAGITAAGATSCLKHYVAGGLSEGGHNGVSVKCGSYGLLNAEVRPFRAAIRAGAREVMSTYHDIDGEPCTSSRYLLEDVLRGQLGFRGFVRSDAGALESGWGLRMFNTIPEAFAATLRAGGDTDYQRNTIEACGAGWREAYDRGLITEQDLDRAVRRVLRAKFELGLFERPYAETPAGWQAVSPVEDELTLEAARKSLVLLKNDGTLPLAAPKRVAVIGPNAGERIMNQLGDYSYTQRREDVVTVLDGVRKLAQGAEVRYTRGCAVRDADRSGFPSAIALAKDSDVTVLVLGGCSSPFSPDDYDPVNGGVRANTSSNAAKSDKECGEGTDRCTLNYLGVQQELFREIRMVAKKLVVVLIQGRPLDAEELLGKADAVLLAWYPGSRGGEAVAEALYGKVNPGGRLSVSIPRSSGQLPVVDDSRWPKRREYIDGPSDALLPAGFGLSYTTFAYSDFEMVERDGRGVPKRLAVTVKNTGARTGDEIIRFYLTVRGTGRQRPWRELIDFVRVSLAPGESKRVFGEVREEFVGHYDRDGRFVPPSAKCVYRFSADGCPLPAPTGLSFDSEKGFVWTNPEDSVKGAQQLYYRILVATSKENLERDNGDMWDSGEVCWPHSDHGNRYRGKALEPGKTYWWKVKSSLDFVWTEWSAPHIAAISR